MNESESDVFLIEWGRPPEHGAHHGLNRYLEDLWRKRLDLQAAFPDLDGPDGAEFVRWVYTSGRFEHPIPDALLPPCPEDMTTHALEPEVDPITQTAAGGVNVVGYLRGELGLGEAARMVIEGLDAVAVPVLPVDAGVRDAGRDGAEFTAVPADAAAFRATLACANPEVLGQLRRDRRPAIRELVPTRGTIAYIWWEIEDQVPVQWRMEDLSWLGEIWVGSDHVQRCLAPFMPVPVVNVGLPINPDPPVVDARQALGLPSGFCFLTAFDYASDLRRKNPLGAIQAFSAAFEPGSGVSLIVKCTSAATYPHDHALVASAASAHPDIHLIDRLLPDAEYNALIAACDCYVSLHRAEGFGLPLANAMFHGRPVVATAYSGNLDFMTADNGYLVPAVRGPVAASDRYPVDGVWAEPDPVAAIDALRAVVADPAQAAAKGRLAAADIRRTHAPEVVGQQMANRLVQLRLRPAARPVADAARALIASGPPAAPPDGEPAAYLDHRRRLDEALVAAIAQVDARSGRHADAMIRAGALAHAATLAQQRAARRALALRDAAAGLSAPDVHAPPAGTAPLRPSPAAHAGARP